MQKQTLANVKIGNMNSNHVACVLNAGCRQQAQFDAVINFHKANPSAWWGNNPFKLESNNKVYKCTFVHTYFDVHGSLKMIRVMPSGKIQIVCPEDDAYTGHWSKEAKAVLAVHGAFQGA